MEENRKLTIYLDKQTYDRFIILCNKKGQVSYDVARDLIKKVVEYSK